MASLSPAAFSIALLLLVALYTLVSTVAKGLRTPLNKVPGPWYARWTNLPLKVATVTGRRIYYVHSLHQKYGPYVRLSPSEVAVNDVRGYKQIHAIGSGFTKSPWYANLTPMSRPGVFALSDVKAHAARRRLFARAFSKSHLREHWEQAAIEKVTLAVSRLRGEALQSGKADILKWWTFMTSDVSAQLVSVMPQPCHLPRNKC